MVIIYCCVNSGSIWGLAPYVVKIEADISQGMPYFNMVGLLSSEVREARERVRTAIKNAGENLPYGRITVSLSPADKRKEGAGFDLPIAISLLAAMGRIDKEQIKDTIIVGELGLDGQTKYIKGVLPIVIMAKEKGYKRCIIPYDNIGEGRVINDIDIIPVRSLKDLLDLLSNEELISKREKIYDEYKLEFNNKSNLECIQEIDTKSYALDFSQIVGQETGKRATIVAASGGHNLLYIGTPGSGKSMLAARIPTILPKLTIEEQIEISKIHSICGLLGSDGLIKNRPYRAPHHTITSSALIGGGKYPKPGEITIAHKGVLFLDELPEFQPRIIDSLRQPLEDKTIKIARMGGSYEFPADCFFVAAMNPCRCGYFPDRNRCNCSEVDINNYMGRISGPFLDRIDICAEVSRMSIEEIDSNGQGESS